MKSGAGGAQCLDSGTSSEANPLLPPHPPGLGFLSGGVSARLGAPRFEVGSAKSVCWVGRGKEEGAQESSRPVGVEGRGHRLGPLLPPAMLETPLHQDLRGGQGPRRNTNDSKT